MLTVAVAAAATTTVAAAETFKTADWLNRWQTRGINLASAPSPWLDAAFASTATALALIYTQSPWAAATVAITTWLLAFAARTDLATGRIPREPTWAVLLVGSILAAATLSPGRIVAALVTFAFLAVLVLLLLAVTRGGLGSGDARLLLATAPIAAFTGTIPFLIGLAVASVTQIVLRVTGAAPANGHGYVFAPALCFGLTAGWLWGLGADTLTYEWTGILPL